VAGDRYFLTAGQAAETLGVSRPTLYAYASRGQLRSEPVPGRPRERRYHRDEVERLRERQESRRDPAKAAARGLHWGGAVLESGITLIHNGTFYYRGHDAIRLAGHASVEDVAALLWGAPEAERPKLFARPMPLGARQLARVRACASDPFIQLQIALAVASATDAAGHDRRPPAVRQTGGRIVRLLATVLGQSTAAPPVHLALERAWSAPHLRLGGAATRGARGGVRREGAPRAARSASGVGEAIRAALILCADHELNVSAFTARCAASAGACPYDVVSAGMSTLKGFKHGGAAERVLALVAEATTIKRTEDLVARRLRSGEGVPGFGHRLYPDGDPRAAVLIRLAEAGPDEAAWRPFRNLLRVASEVLDDRPNLDFGLAAMTRTYGLPEQAPMLLFALGRTIGWIAHAIEEYASDQLIRPRARYTGPAPDAVGADSIVGAATDRDQATRA
jgi:citrate synthase